MKLIITVFLAYAAVTVVSSLILIALLFSEYRKYKDFEDDNQA